MNSKILHKALCVICLPKYYAENKMNLFRLSFLLFILKWSAGKGFCSGTLAKNYRLLLFLFFRYMKHLHSNMKWAIRVPGQSEVSQKHAKS